jgi:aconitate hydratase
MKCKKEFGGHIVIAKENYAQGSSREHAALAPKYLGQVAVIAQSYARIAWQNLVNFGIVPLEFINTSDYNKIDQGDLIRFKNLRDDVMNRKNIQVNVEKADGSTLEFETKHSLSDRQINVLAKGGIINDFRTKV